MNRKLAALSVVPLIALGACGVTTQPDEVKLAVGDGPWEDPKYKKCIQPGVKTNTPTNDRYISFSTAGRDYDAGTTEKADAPPITVLSDDNAEMAIPVRLTFEFNTDCETLKDFQDEYGRYGDVFTVNDDNVVVHTDAWMTILHKVMGNTLDTKLDEASKAYKWRELYNDAQAQNNLQIALNENLQAQVDEAAQGPYFLDVTVATLKKPVPTNEELKANIAAEQAAVAKAQSAEAEARARKLQAQAEVAVARAEAEKQQAAIRGYMLEGMTPEEALRAYNQAQLIAKGGNPYQPTYIVGGTAPTR